MSLESLSPDDINKIKQIVEAGEKVLEEIDTLKEGLSDAVKGLANELDCKPTVINKAIRLAHQNRKDDAIADAQRNMTEVEIILHAAGKI